MAKYTHKQVDLLDGYYSISDIPNGEYTIIGMVEYNKQQQFYWLKHILINDDIENVKFSNTDPECVNLLLKGRGE